ncbi:hypothetical protein TWF694_001781 [Orbilia ellipsospora]|uniref:Uncharacterized protein n=1 Tax=Orbilia ellipsospora TaxID=2528407 RepID=A0AAV9X3L2_9PEZI
MPPPPPHPSITSTSSDKAASSSAASGLESSTDDPKTLELREFAVTALESFEMQAILSFTNDQSLARTRHQLLKRLIGLPPNESTTNTGRAGGEESSVDGQAFENNEEDGYGETSFRSSRGSRR